MGLKLFGHSSWANSNSVISDKITQAVNNLRGTLEEEALRKAEEKLRKEVNFTNPRPTKFRIIETFQVGHYLVAQIKYPDAKNYEGMKVMVYEGLLDTDLRKRKVIDPHFSNIPHDLSPIARFEPTTRGWKMAIKFAKTMLKEK